MAWRQMWRWIYSGGYIYALIALPVLALARCQVFILASDPRPSPNTTSPVPTRIPKVGTQNQIPGQTEMKYQKA